MRAQNIRRFIGSFSMLRNIALISLSVIILSLASSAALKAQQAPELVIFHTNDVHGYALPVWDKSGRLLNIGYAVFKGYVDSVRAPNKLLLDAGDALSGQPFATVQQGLLVARMLELVKYDAIAVGNHDFDFGTPRLVELTFKYDLNFISANTHKKEDGTRLFKPYIIKDYGGLKVGVFALTTPETAFKTHPDNVSALAFSRPAEIGNLAEELTAQLRREGAQLVIALTHLGTTAQNSPSAQDIARAVPDLDLIIDGHSHSEVAGLKEGKVLIVSTGAHFKNIGQVEVRRGNKGQFVLSTRLVTAAEAGLVPPDPALDALGATLEAEMERELNQVVATLPFALDGNEQVSRVFSTNLGRLICAALKRSTGAELAIINSGSIRAGLPAGEVTRKQLLQVLPFGNHAVTVKLSGSELIETVNHGLSQAGEGGFPQFYGMTVTAIELKNKADGEEEAPNGGRVDIIEIGGRPISPEDSYTVVVNDFMYSGGDGYRMLSGRPGQQYATVEEIFLKYLSETNRETLDFVNLDDVLTVLVEE